MSELSEEEIIKYIKDEIENETDTYHWFDNTPNNKTRKQIEESIKAHQGLLDLYQKEKMNSSNLGEQLNKEKEKSIRVRNFLDKLASSLDYARKSNDIVSTTQAGLLERIIKEFRELLEERN